MAFKNFKNERELKNVNQYYKKSVQFIERQARENREALNDLIKNRPLTKVLGIR